MGLLISKPAPARAIDPLDVPLFYFADNAPWSGRMAIEGTLITGSPGSGKSSTSGKNLAHALLRAGWGGLVLTAKSEETDNWREYAENCGRSKDLIVFNAESGHMYDPLFYEWNRPGRGAGDLEAIIDMFSTLLTIGKPKTGGEGHSSDQFWERATEQLMRNVLVLLSLAGEPISIESINRIVQSLPTEPGMHETEKWQQESPCAALINKIRERSETLTKNQWLDLEMATIFAFNKWPNDPPETRGGVEMHWAGMASKFLFDPFRRLFCSGKCTFVPDQTYLQNKVVVCDFPMLEYGHETGRLINVLLKLCFQRAWLRRKEKDGLPCTFIFQDEFQYFIHRRDNFFQQTTRGAAKCGVICLSQNISNLSEELGESEIGSKTKSFLGNLKLKIAHQQNETDTAFYLSRLIGQEWRYIDNYSKSGSDDGGSMGAGKQLVNQVEPIEFSELGMPDADSPNAEAIIYNGGKRFAANGKNHLKVQFSRNI